MSTANSVFHFILQEALITQLPLTKKSAFIKIVRIANCYKTQPNSKDIFIVQSIYKKGGDTNVIEYKGNMPGICTYRASVDKHARLLYVQSQCE